MKNERMNYQGSTITETPDEIGNRGRAWRARLPDPGQRSKTDTDGTVAAWLVHAPAAHPFWSWYLVSVIHLRPIAGVKPAVITKPGATHELMILALNPEHALPPLDLQSGVRYLTPIDVVEQFEAANDAVANQILELSVRAIVTGYLSPDQDWRRDWRESIRDDGRTLQVWSARSEIELMNRTPIGWTDYSANPLKYRTADGRIVWACEKLSLGCSNCYAEELSTHYGGIRRAGDWNAAVMATLTPFLDAEETHRMRTYKPASGQRVFVADMTDLFGSWVADDLLNRLYSQTLEVRGDVTWQLLTKRADRMSAYLNWRYEGRIPSRHIHHGVSVENRSTLSRLNYLGHMTSAIRWVSFEPLLEDLGDLSPWIDAIDWGVIGLESGRHRRPGQNAWMRSIAEQLIAAGKPVFVKQGSGLRPGQPTGDPFLDSLKQPARSAVPA